MTRIALTAAFVAGSALSAYAAGIERTAPSPRVLFEDGRYFELSATLVSPDLSGEGGLLSPAGSTGDLLQHFASFDIAYKADLTDRISYALTLGTPWGVDTEYPVVAGSGYSGTAADLDSYALTGIVSYEVTPNITAYGGVVGQYIEAVAFFPFGAALGLAGPYQVDAEGDFGFGFMGGVAYEREDIALRVALTYYSEIEHDLSTTETNGAAVSSTSTDIATPQSVNLEFQTGIMEDTLLFGSVRWVDWSEFSIAPPVFTAAVGAPLVDYEEDWITYTLGVGRKFNENWSGAVQGSWEPASDTTLTTLGPVDGRWSVGLSATYTYENTKITGGLSYISLGEAENFAGTAFDDGSAIAAGVRIGWYF
ncbi:hypothetical protein GE300_15465 [Rhodobacteraceae bacterium 2CG4]|uniref:Long-chain fatty acid transport protein n=1 Tax=Halovulum marinum TaxID=2662447 RepID=A0A6L5Z4N9_9RHOB|nr:outer membrane protein transport protein [Halovulum marinum]MSU90992.1 hypothetical protein [Halovulum marinum]